MDGLWAFGALAVVLSLTPGADDVLVLRCSLRGGPRAGVAATLGVAAGSLLWGAAAATGFAAFVADSPVVYDALRWAGACYLVLLGTVPLLVSAVGGRRPVRVGAHRRVPEPASGTARAFAGGLASDVLNPKIGVFYLMVIPQFVPAGEPVLPFSLLLCAIDVGVATAWLLALTWTAHAAVRWLARPPVVTGSKWVFSATLVGLGAAAAFGL